MHGRDRAVPVPSIGLHRLDVEVARRRLFACDATRLVEARCQPGAVAPAAELSEYRLIQRCGP